MQTLNNYDKDVYNGNIGFIRSLDVIEVDELTLAYVVSVHKAQGSEFPVVVMPIVTQHYLMLQRNLRYMALEWRLGK